MTTQEDEATIDKEICPACGQKTLTLLEKEIDIPYFQKSYFFSMTCSNEDCLYHMSDVELEKSNGPVKLEFEISSEEDMSVRVVKSAAATVKIPRITTIEPGSVSTGYITNVEGILQRVKRIVEKTKEDSDDKSIEKKCKTMIKKIQDVIWGRESIKLIIEDPTGNSAIISEKTIITKK